MRSCFLDGAHVRHRDLIAIATFVVFIECKCLERPPEVSRCVQNTKKMYVKVKKIWTRQTLEALYRRDFDVVEICWRLRHETIPWWWTLGGWERPPAEISSGETRSSRGWTLVQVSWVDLARTPSCIADSALRRRALITKPNTSPVNNGRCYTECSISAIRDTFSSHRFWLLQPWLSVLFLFFKQ